MLEIIVPYYLGIDGGGTKTTCAVGDESQLLATATAGPSNIVRVGEAQARESLQQSVRQACAAAGITPAQVAHTCVGGSGAARPELAEIVRRSLAEILPTPIDVVGDMQIALEAAFDTGPGVIVIAGTGSIAYGRDRQGTTAPRRRLGICHRRRRFRALDRTHRRQRRPARRRRCSGDLSDLQPVPTPSRDGSPTPSPQDSSLAAALCKAWGVGSLADLARAANSIPPPDFAALFPAVAASSDRSGRAGPTKAGRELAQVAAVVIRRLFRGRTHRARPGGHDRRRLSSSPLVRQDFYNELRKLDPRAEINPQVVEPVEGALRMARRAAHVDYG